MSYRRTSYRKDTKNKPSSIHSLQILKIAVSALSLLLALSGYMMWKKMNELHHKIEHSFSTVKKYEEELSILRTVNPYPVDSQHLVPTAVANSDVIPGWVTRIYPLPSEKQTPSHYSDLGSFVMNSIQFNLATHKMYGITQPLNSMYRLSGLLPTSMDGRYQIGIHFNFIDSYSSGAQAEIKLGSCFAKLAVDNKPVIDERIRVSSRHEMSRVVTGDIDLDMGVSTIEALIYCDEKSDFNSQDVEVSFLFRNPNQHKLTNSDNIYHIYSNNLFSKL